MSLHVIIGLFKGELVGKCSFRCLELSRFYCFLNLRNMMIFGLFLFVLVNSAFSLECSGDNCTCPSGETVNRNVWCDGKTDCSDEYDEADETCKFVCNDTGNTIIDRIHFGFPAQVCDGVEDCPNGDDEMNCEFTKLYTCGDGNVITQHQLCDGINDCTDGLDEFACNQGCDSIDIDECADTGLCQNGGTCTNEPGTYSCTCTQGWTGTNCQTDIDECTNTELCQNGTCINEQGTYSCTCTQGWTGTNCQTDIDECADTELCQNGTCINEQGTYSCTCTQGWTGTNCQTDIDECTNTELCQNGTCINEQGTYSCTCTQGLWTGTICETVCEQFGGVDNVTNCNYTNQRNDGLINVGESYECTCIDGYASDAGIGNTISSTCEDTDWSTIQTCVPVCPLFTGTVADNTEGCQYMNQRNDGLIVDQSSYECNCAAYRVSDSDGSTVVSSICNAGQWTPMSNCVIGCKKFTLLTDHLISKPATGFTQEIGTSDYIYDGGDGTIYCNGDPIANIKCEGGIWVQGTCPTPVCFQYLNDATAGVYWVSDSKEYVWATGRPTCQNICSDYASFHSLNEAVFAGSMGANAWIGLLDPGNVWVDRTPFDYNGFATGEPKHIEVAPNVECYYAGWPSADRWDDIGCNAAANTNTGNSLKRSSCRVTVIHCIKGWTGTNCETDIDECTNTELCQNGMCINEPGTYSCTCTQGWTGTNCDTDIDECTNTELCQNRTCINEPGTYSCICTQGLWTGTICETVCEQFPSVDNVNNCNYTNQRNDGLINEGESYECTCIDGYASDAGIGNTISSTCEDTGWSTIQTCVPGCKKFTLLTDHLISKPTTGFTPEIGTSDYIYDGGDGTIYCNGEQIANIKCEGGTWVQGTCPTPVCFQYLNDATAGVYWVSESKEYVWATGRPTCQNICSDYASFHSLNEAVFAGSMGAHAWIGLLAPGNVWVDGTPFDYNGFATGEPKHIEVAPNVECYYAGWPSADRWDDIGCNAAANTNTGNSLKRSSCRVTVIH